MSTIKEKTLKELENKVNDLENFIAKRGIGSSYLGRAEKIQRNFNIGLFVGGIALVGGVVAYTLLKSDDEDDE